MKITKIKDLTGHSGATISLFKDDADGTFFCRKRSASVIANSRLRKQCAKQIMFSRSNFSWKTPKVLRLGYEGQLFYFDMDFLHGDILANRLPQLTDIAIKKWIDVFFLNSVSKFETGTKQVSYLDPICFANKLRSLEYELQNICVDRPLLSEITGVLYNYGFSRIPISPCHGDLTLENILINQTGDVFLIDFLDSFADSWYIDAAKILQDLEAGWSWRNLDFDMNRELMREIGLKYFRKKLIEHHALIPVYHVLLLNLIRILPYAKDIETIDFLMKSLGKVYIFLKKQN